MTEAEWLTSEDLAHLIKFQRQAGRQRKLRLFACACARRVLDRLPAGSLGSALDLSERFAEGAADQAELDEGYRTAMRAWTTPTLHWAGYIGVGASVLNPDAAGTALYTATHTPAVAVPAGTPCRKAALAVERRATLELFRDVFGNPFRSVAFSAEWRTDTAVALARQMYDSWDFGAMPILADALQDAGCESEDILGHCRDPEQVHVRGCWVVDLVIGKE